MRRWSRVLGTTYLLTIFSTSLFVAHRHLNPIADLVTGGPSDSGTFLRAEAHPGAGAAIGRFSLVDDEPCPACFWHDFQAVAAARMGLVAPVSILSGTLRSIEAILRSLPADAPIIRGPPARSI